MSAVRPVDSPRSNQKALYAPGSPGGGGRSARVSASRLSAATSSSVSRSRPECCVGRSSGVIVANDQSPWRLGSPHDVRDSVHSSEVASRGCPAAPIGMNNAPPISASHNVRTQAFMVPSWSDIAVVLLWIIADDGLARNRLVMVRTIQ